MCTRYISPDQAAIERQWHIGRHNQIKWATELFPRAHGPFLRAGEGAIDLVVGQWGLVPHWAESPKLAYSTVNCRSEEMTSKPTFRDAWAKGQRCIIPAVSFDEPCWETGKNVWWRFKRKDGQLWGLAGLWNTWIDRASGEVVESYTMLTINADSHPVMSRMHQPDPKLAADKQDKRSVVALAMSDAERWLGGSSEDARSLLVLTDAEEFEAGPAEQSGELSLF